MADVTLATLAARRKALADHAEYQAWQVHGTPDKAVAVVESALVQAQRDLLNELSKAVTEMEAKSERAVAFKRGVLALLDRALAGEPPAPKE